MSYRCVFDHNDPCLNHILFSVPKVSVSEAAEQSVGVLTNSDLRAFHCIMNNTEPKENCVSESAGLVEQRRHNDIIT